MANQKAKLLTFITIVILLLLIGSYYQFIHPLLSEREQTAAQLMSLQEEYRLTLAPAIDEQEDPYIRLDQIRTEIPELPYEEHIIQAIRQAESSSGVEVSGIVPRVNRAEQEIIQPESVDATNPSQSLAKLIVIKVSYTGSNEQTDRFLRAIDRSARLLQITSLNMKGASSIDSLVSSEIEISSYYVPDMKPLYNQPMLFTGG